MNQPKEILEMVFFQLDVKTKLELSLVSPFFNKVFSNTFRLLTDVTVSYNGTRDHKRILVSRGTTRPYQSMVYTGEYIESGVVEFVRTYQNTLTTLQFVSCSVPWTEFCSILDCVAGKLKVLHLEDAKLVHPSEPSAISLPNLTELSVVNTSKYNLTPVFNLIDATGITKLSYADARDGKSHWIFHENYNFGELQACLSLVKRQKNLKWLSLPKQPSRVLVDEFAENVPTFQLETLVMPMYQTEVLDVFDRIPGPNLMTFLTTQMNSLTHLWMSDESVLTFEDTQILLETFKLKEFRFYGDFVWNRSNNLPKLENNSIERLEIGNCRNDSFYESINGHSMCTILRSCHGVKTLCLTNVAVTRLTSSAIMEMTSLKKLEVNNCALSVLLDCTKIESVELTTACQNCILQMGKVNRHMTAFESKPPSLWRYFHNR